MRLVVWNCHQALDKKIEPLVGLRPDIAIIPECASPQTPKLKNALIRYGITQSFWDIKSIFVLSLILSQLAVGKSFAKDSATQIILSEVVDSGSTVQKVVEKLTSKMKQMTDQDGNPVNLEKFQFNSAFLKSEPMFTANWIKIQN